MQTILKSSETETQRTAVLTEEYHEGAPVFKLEVKTEKTYFLPKDWFDEVDTLNCLLDMINELKKQGFKIIDKINKQTT
jgi:hypothetical protein